MLKRKFKRILSVFSIVFILVSFVFALPCFAISESLTSISYNYSDDAPNGILPFVKTAFTLDGDTAVLPNVNTYPYSDAFDEANWGDWNNRTKFVRSEGSYIPAYIDLDDKRYAYTQSFGFYTAASYTVEYLTCVDEILVGFSGVDNPLYLDTTTFDLAETTVNIKGGACKIPAGLDIKENNYRFYFDANEVSGQVQCLIDISYSMYQFDTYYDNNSETAITELMYIGSVYKDSISVSPGQVVRLFDKAAIEDGVIDGMYDSSEDVFIDNVEITVTAQINGEILDVSRGLDSAWAYRFQLLTPITLSGTTQSDVFDGGYDLFYDVPVIESKVSVVDFEDISLVAWFTTQIDSLLAAQLIPNVSIGHILWFCVGLGMFFFILKAFLGG